MNSIITTINGEKIFIKNPKNKKIAKGSNIVIQSKNGLEYVKAEKILDSSKSGITQYEFLRLANYSDTKKYKKNQR